MPATTPTHRRVVIEFETTGQPVSGVIREQGEFVPGSPYVFFKDPDGYEIEIWYEKLPS